MDLDARRADDAVCGTITDADLSGLAMDPVGDPEALPPIAQKTPGFSRHISIEAVFGAAVASVAAEESGSTSSKPVLFKSKSTFEPRERKAKEDSMFQQFLQRARTIPNAALKKLCNMSELIGGAVLDDIERFKIFGSYIEEKFIKTRAETMESCNCSKFRVSEGCEIFPARLIVCSIKLCLTEALSSKINDLVVEALNLLRTLDKNIATIELCLAPLFASDLSITSSALSKFEDSKLDSESFIEEFSSLKQSSMLAEDDFAISDELPSTPLSLVKSVSMPSPSIASLRVKPRSSGKLSQTNSTKQRDPILEAMTIVLESFGGKVPKWFIDELTKLLLDISDARLIIGQKFARRQLLPMYFQALLLSEKMVTDANVKSIAVLLNANSENCSILASVNNWPKLFCDLLLHSSVLYQFEDAKSMSDKTQELEELVEEEGFYEPEVIQRRRTTVLFSEEVRAQLILTMIVAVLKNQFLHNPETDLEKHILEFQKEINGHSLPSRQSKEIYKLFLDMLVGTLSKQDIKLVPLDNVLKNSIPLCRQVLKYVCTDDSLENEVSFHVSKSFIPEDLGLASALDQMLSKLISATMLDARVNKDIAGYRDVYGEVLSPKEFKSVLATVEENKKLTSELVVFFESLRDKTDKLKDEEILSIAESLSVVIKKWGLRKEILRSVIVKKLVNEIQSSLKFLNSDVAKKADSKLVKLRLQHVKEKDLLAARTKLGLK